MLRNDIQGLRAIAVFGVIIFHADKSWLPGGFTGVDIFLVVSGFLITGIILKAKQRQQFSAIDFYVKRLKRIAPAYYVMLAVVSLVAGVLMIAKDFEFFQESLLSALSFTSNQYFSDFGDYFAPSAHELPLLHTWSLAVEMQFYLLLPLMVMLLPQRYLAYIVPILVIVITGIVAWQLQDPLNKQALYFSLLARVPEFLLGSILAIVNIGKNWTKSVSSFVAWLGVLLILISFFLINETLAFPGVLALLPCLGAACIIASNQGKVSQLLSSSGMVWLGALSYSLYLWHWPILSFIRYYSEQYALSLSQLFLFVVTTFMIAYISWRWIENPFRKQAKISAFVKRATLFFSAVSLLIFLGIRLNNNVVPTMSVEMSRYADQSTICHGKIVGTCLLGDLDSDKEILLLGDSHGAQLNLAFDELGQKLNFKSRVITGSSCVTIPGFDANRIPAWAQKACLSQINSAHEHLSTAKLVVLAGKWSYHMQSPEFIHALESFLKRAREEGKRVIVLGQVPMFENNLSRIIRFTQLGMPTNIIENKTWKDANLRISRIVSSYPNSQFIGVATLALFQNAPFYNGQIIYYDKHHLNEIGAKLYAEIIRPIWLDINK